VAGSLSSDEIFTLVLNGAYLSPTGRWSPSRRSRYEVNCLFIFRSHAMNDVAIGRGKKPRRGCLLNLTYQLTPSQPSPRGRGKKGRCVGRLLAINMTPRWGFRSVLLVYSLTLRALRLCVRYFLLSLQTMSPTTPCPLLIQGGGKPHYASFFLLYELYKLDELLSPLLRYSVYSGPRQYPLFFSIPRVCRCGCRRRCRKQPIRSCLPVPCNSRYPRGVPGSTSK